MFFVNFRDGEKKLKIMRILFMLISPLDYLTRNSAIADKPRDAFRGQSRLPDMVPFHAMYGFLLVCYSKIVPKTSNVP